MKERLGNGNQRQGKLAEYVDHFLAIMPDGGLDILGRLHMEAREGGFEIFKEGDHSLTFSKTEWPYVVKILKENDERNLVLKRHIEALKWLQGLIAEFTVIQKQGKSIVLQEKMPFILTQKLETLVSKGFFDQAKKLIEDYAQFNFCVWQRGMFDWHFRIDHVGLNVSGSIVLFDIGGVRGRPSLSERIKWRIGYFGRKHKKNIEILSLIHPSLADIYGALSRKTLTRRSAEHVIFKFYQNVDA